MMSDNPNVNSEMPGDQSPGSESQQSFENSWHEVGRQFQTLGESLAQTVRTAWQNEETQRQLQEMRTGLESMVKDVEKAIKDSAETPQGQQIRQDVSRAAGSLREAGEQTVQEVRPHLIDALQKVNIELQKLVDRMENKE
jgi:predicted transcriptional regulator